jgi:hypothetical protein
MRLVPMAALFPMPCSSRGILSGRSAGASIKPMRFEYQLLCKNEAPRSKLKVQKNFQEPSSKFQPSLQPSALELGAWSFF